MRKRTIGRFESFLWALEIAAVPGCPGCGEQVECGPRDSPTKEVVGCGFCMGWLT